MRTGHRIHHYAGLAAGRTRCEAAAILQEEEPLRFPSQSDSDQTSFVGQHESKCFTLTSMLNENDFDLLSEKLKSLATCNLVRSTVVRPGISTAWVLWHGEFEPAAVEAFVVAIGRAELYRRQRPTRTYAVFLDDELPR